MTPEQMKIACVAFRSDEYVQVYYSIGSGNHTCAIGVCGKANGLKSGYTTNFSKALDMTDKQIDLLIDWNDADNMSFPDIADLIESHPEFLGGVE